MAHDERARERHPSAHILNVIRQYRVHKLRVHVHHGEPVRAATVEEGVRWRRLEDHAPVPWLERARKSPVRMSDHLWRGGAGGVDFGG